MLDLYNASSVRGSCLVQLCYFLILFTKSYATNGDERGILDTNTYRITGFLYAS